MYSPGLPTQPKVITRERAMTGPPPRSPGRRVPNSATSFGRIACHLNALLTSRLASSSGTPG
eukprot:15347998-Heterocapsa_arctica.AAC.1